jgi:hypothetical protein
MEPVKSCATSLIKAAEPTRSFWLPTLTPTLKGTGVRVGCAGGDHVAERNNVSAIFDVVFVAGGAPPPPDSGPQPPPDNPPPNDGIKRVFLPLVTR